MWWAMTRASSTSKRRFLCVSLPARSARITPFAMVFGLTPRTRAKARRLYIDPGSVRLLRRAASR